MHFLIDFDYTLFDTNYMRFLLAQRLGITEEAFRAAEKQIKELGELYTPSRHCELLGIDEKDFKKVLPIIADALYLDTYLFFKKYEGAQMTILTFGNVAWQEQKIEASEIEYFVQDIVATDLPKEEVVCQWENERDIVIINDRGSEIDAMATVLPHARTIWVRREGTPYREEPCARASMTVRDLSEINL